MSENFPIGPSPPAPTQATETRMAQAESVTTANRELMPRGQPPKSTSPADCEVLEARADHLQRVFAALHVYVTAIIAEITEKIPGSTLDRHYLDQLFRGLSAEALRVFRDAAAEMRGHENWRAS
jgi:hypothetical protein